ncbi:MAG: c-type cytochrome domain-containing protein, partial [Gimesia chilikensis]
MALRRSPLLFLLFWLSLVSTDLAAKDRPLDFKTDIAPLFADHCVRCHSPDNTKGGVSLAGVQDLLDNGYLTPGKPDESYLLELVTSQEVKPPAMPQEASPLSDQQV